MREYHEPTVRSRELGLALMRAAKAKGFMGKDIAHEMGWSRTKVSNLYNGRRGTPLVDIASFLGRCGVAGPKRDELLRMAVDALKPGWWQEYGDRLPPDLRTLSDQEDAAIGITEFQTTLVPGLLQTESYTRALMHSQPYVPKEEIEERVALRMMRHQILDRFRPPRFRFFVDEYVVSRTGCGPEIMSDQVHHLLRMAVRPYVEIRIIPDAVGFHGGRDPFRLMDFTEFNPVVFMENATSALFLEQKETIATYRRIVVDLDRVALDEGQSRAWIARVATALGEPREEPDEHAPPREPDVAEEYFHEHG